MADLKVSDILKLPLPAVLKGTNEESKRKAGILLHITSYPVNMGQVMLAVRHTISLIS